MKVAEFRSVADKACRLLGLWSPAAVELVVMTACHESRLEFRRQLGGGPALGLCQMEPATYNDHWQNFLPYQPELRAKLVGLVGVVTGVFPSPEIMVTNDLYAAAMCRIHYRRVKAPLPPLSDVDGLARYWKDHYNTAKGAGTPEQFKSSYIALVVRDVWAAVSAG